MQARPRSHRPYPFHRQTDLLDSRGAFETLLAQSYPQPWQPSRLIQARSPLHPPSSNHCCRGKRTSQRKQPGLDQVKGRRASFMKNTVLQRLEVSFPQRQWIQHQQQAAPFTKQSPESTLSEHSSLASPTSLLILMRIPPIILSQNKEGL